MVRDPASRGERHSPKQPADLNETDYTKHPNGSSLA